MISLRQRLSQIGAPTTGSVSILFHLFGLLDRRVPDDPDPTVSCSLSLRSKLTAVDRRHLNINVICVGWDAFTTVNREEVEYAIYRAHGILGAGQIALWRISRYHIDGSASGGRDDIGSEDEAEDLTQEWTVGNDGLDVFIVANISDTGFVGISPIGGPCDKNAKGMNGVLGGEVNRGSLAVARTFSHEICHYLGLSHNHDAACPTALADRDRLMAQTRCANSTRDSTVLNDSERITIRTHCAVKNQ